MNDEPLAKFWNLIHSIVLEFWGITEPHIEDTAVKNDIPIELYFYSELGLDYFSIEGFQKRDPFSNPEQFEKMFARFEVKDWIFPIPGERYQVSRQAQNAVHMIVQAGDAQLADFDLMSEKELWQLTGLLKQIAKANFEAPEPPEKWAVINRFRVANEQSPLIVQIRELLMYLFAYHDDSHLSAARPHFGQAGIVWVVLGAIAGESAVNATQMAESMAFRGYENTDYEVAIQAAVEIGWVEPADTLNSFRPTQKGMEIRAQVEKLTDEYFYRPWAVLTKDDAEILYDLLVKLRDNLISYGKSLAGDSHY
jgi:hypothetical protein